jgi:hypothetical protein
MARGRLQVSPNPPAPSPRPRSAVTLLNGTTLSCTTPTDSRPRSHRSMEQRCLRVRRLHRAAAGSSSRVRPLHSEPEQWRLRAGSAYQCRRHPRTTRTPISMRLLTLPDCTPRPQHRRRALMGKTPLLRLRAEVTSSPAPPSRHPGGWRLSRLP